MASSSRSTTSRRRPSATAPTPCGCRNSATCWMSCSPSGAPAAKPPWTTPPRAPSAMPALLRVAPGLELRPLRLADAPSLFKLVEANRAHLRRWLSWVDGTAAEADTRTFIHLNRALQRQGQLRTFALWWKGRQVGVAGLHSLDEENASGAIGYWLASDAEGRGLMTKAVGRLLDLAFGPMKLHRVELRAGVRNR